MNLPDTACWSRQLELQGCQKISAGAWVESAIPWGISLVFQRSWELKRVDRDVLSMSGVWYGIGRTRHILTDDIHTTVSTKHVERPASTQEQ